MQPEEINSNEYKEPKNVKRIIKKPLQKSAHLPKLHRMDPRIGCCLIRHWLRYLFTKPGQKVNVIVPHIELTHEQEKEIAMLSFPDSNSLGDYEGTFKYIFKYPFYYQDLKITALATPASNKKKILKIPGVTAKSHSLCFPSCPFHHSSSKWQSSSCSKPFTNYNKFLKTFKNCTNRPKNGPNRYPWQSTFCPFSNMNWASKFQTTS